MALHSLDSVDLSIPPRPDQILKDSDFSSFADNFNAEKSVTYGDMHGNALKLLWCLLQSGAVELIPEMYECFKNTYLVLYKDTKYKPEKKSFEYALQVIKMAINSIVRVSSRSISIRLIGDLLADRGKDDYITLLLLNRLDEIGVPFEIMLSNHDRWFIEFMEGLFSLEDKEKAKEESVKVMCGPPLRLIKGDQPYQLQNLPEVKGTDKLQSASLFNMIESLKAGKIDLQKLTELYSIYKKYLKLISLDQNKDGVPVIYTHAIIDEQTIKDLAAWVSENEDGTKPGSQLKQVNGSYNISYLQEVIDHANEKLKYILQSICYERDAIRVFDSPLFHHITWSRGDGVGNGRDPIRVMNLASIDLSKIQFVHGHNSGNGKKNYAHTDIDYKIGKSYRFFGIASRGNLGIWISIKYTLILQQQKSKEQAHLAQEHIKIAQAIVEKPVSPANRPMFTGLILGLLVGLLFINVVTTLAIFAAIKFSLMPILFTAIVAMVVVCLTIDVIAASVLISTFSTNKSKAVSKSIITPITALQSNVSQNRIVAPDILAECSIKSATRDIAYSSACLTRKSL